MKQVFCFNSRLTRNLNFMTMGISCKIKKRNVDVYYKGLKRVQI